ncbi:MAG: GNAT family N-acetyltransferase, partial [Candidatus Omnitrophica bacterium]|nr:GNAT family N-acetyltransferase [Candidatus Omnitrophota bacterium]
YLETNLGIPQDAVLILSPSRLSKAKRIDLTMGLVAKIKQNYKGERPIHFLILGSTESTTERKTAYSGDEVETYEELKILMEELGLEEGRDVHFLGSLSHRRLKGGKKLAELYTVSDVMQNCDVIIQLSREESFGRINAEAMANGAVVVSSNYTYPGLPEYDTFMRIYGAYYIPVLRDESDAALDRVAGTVCWILSSPARMRRITEWNYKRSRRSMLNASRLRNFLRLFIAELFDPDRQRLSIEETEAGEARFIPSQPARPVRIVGIDEAAVPIVTARPRYPQEIKLVSIENGIKFILKDAGSSNDGRILRYIAYIDEEPLKEIKREDEESPRAESETEEGPCHIELIIDERMKEIVINQWDMDELRGTGLEETVINWVMEYAALLDYKVALKGTEDPVKLYMFMLLVKPDTLRVTYMGVTEDAEETWQQLKPEEIDRLLQRLNLIPFNRPEEYYERASGCSELVLEYPTRDKGGFPLGEMDSGVRLSGEPSPIQTEMRVTTSRRGDNILQFIWRQEGRQIFTAKPPMPVRAKEIIEKVKKEFDSSKEKTGGTHIGCGLGGVQGLDPKWTILSILSGITAGFTLPFLKDILHYFASIGATGSLPLAGVVALAFLAVISFSAIMPETGRSRLEGDEYRRSLEILALENEMDIQVDYARQGLIVDKKPKDGRVRKYTYQKDNGQFMQGKKVGTITASLGVQDEEPITIYSADEGEIIFAEDIKPNECLGTRGIIRCVGCAISARTTSGTFHGIIHIYNDHREGSLKRFSDNVTAFVDMLPDDLSEIKVVISSRTEDEDEEEKDEEDEIKKKEKIAILVRSLKEKFPNIILVEEGHPKGQGESSMLISDETWGVSTRDNKPTFMRNKLVRYWSETTESEVMSFKPEGEPPTPDRGEGDERPGYGNFEYAEGFYHEIYKRNGLRGDINKLLRHVECVSIIVERLADKLGLAPDEKEALYTASLWHDIGKMYNQRLWYLSVFSNKRLPQDADSPERMLINGHSVYSLEIIEELGIDIPDRAKELIRYHHHPEGVVDGHMRLLCEMIFWADRADVMLSDRPYQDREWHIDSFDEFPGRFDNIARRYCPEEIRAHSKDAYDALVSMVTERELTDLYLRLAESKPARPAETGRVRDVDEPAAPDRDRVGEDRAATDADAIKEKRISAIKDILGDSRIEEKIKEFLLRPDVLLTLIGTKPSCSIEIITPDIIPYLSEIKKLIEKRFEGEVGFIPVKDSAQPGAPSPVGEYLLFNKRHIRNIITAGENRSFFNKREKIMAETDEGLCELLREATRLKGRDRHIRQGLFFGYPRGTVLDLARHESLLVKAGFVDTLIIDVYEEREKLGEVLSDNELAFLINYYDQAIIKAGDDKVRAARFKRIGFSWLVTESEDRLKETAETLDRYIEDLKYAESRLGILTQEKADAPENATPPATASPEVNAKTIPDIGDIIKGQKGNEYRIIAKLPVGGSAYIFEAVDIKTRETVIAKHRLFYGDLDNRSFFDREITILKRLSEAGCPYAPRFYDWNVDESGKEYGWIVMEFIKGERLDYWAYSKSQVDIIHKSKELLDILKDLHERGIQHRDLKPSSILITADGRVNVLDFNSAYFSGCEPVSYFSIPMAPYYQPPLGDAPVKYGTMDGVTTAQYDIYQVGVILFRLATAGIYPKLKYFSETNTTEAGIRDRLPIDWKPFAGILAKATAQNPQDRYESTEAMRKAIEEVERSISVSGPPATASPEFGDEDKFEKFIDDIRISTESDLLEVLDMGTGDAEFVVNAQKKPWAEEARFTCIDNNPEKIRAAKSLHQIEVLEMSWNNLEFEKEHFDLITFNYPSPNVAFASVRVAFREAFKVCKPGGGIAFSSIEDPEDGFPSQGIKGVIAQADFTDITILRGNDIPETYPETDTSSQRPIRNKYLILARKPKDVLQPSSGKILDSQTAVGQTTNVGFLEPEDEARAREEARRQAEQEEREPLSIIEHRLPYVYGLLAPIDLETMPLEGLASERGYPRDLEDLKRDIEDARRQLHESYGAKTLLEFLFKRLFRADGAVDPAIMGQLCEIEGEELEISDNPLEYSGHITIKDKVGHRHFVIDRQGNLIERYIHREGYFIEVSLRNVKHPDQWITLRVKEPKKDRTRYNITVDGEIIGHVNYTKLPPEIEEHIWDINNIAVGINDKSYRGKGIGQSINNIFAKWARDAGKMLSALSVESPAEAHILTKILHNPVMDGVDSLIDSVIRDKPLRDDGHFVNPISVAMGIPNPIYLIGDANADFTLCQEMDEETLGQWTAIQDRANIGLTDEDLANIDLLEINELSPDQAEKTIEFLATQRPSLSKTSAKAMFERWKRDIRSVVIIGFCKAKVVGCIAAMHGRPEHLALKDNQMHCCIDDIFVMQPLRRKGIGALLFQHMRTRLLTSAFNIGSVDEVLLEKTYISGTKAAKEFWKAMFGEEHIIDNRSHKWITREGFESEIPASSATASPKLDDVEKTPEKAKTAPEDTEKLTIPKTYFGRDGNALDFVVCSALDEAVDVDGEGFRVLTAGSSDGREGYDVVMSIAEYVERTGKKVRAKVIITDIDPRLVEIARSGVYKREAVASPLRENDLDCLDPDRMALRHSRFFTSVNKDSVRFMDADTLRDKYGIEIEFRPLDILDSAAVQELAENGRFNLIIARNIKYQKGFESHEWVKIKGYDETFLVNLHRLLNENGMAEIAYSNIKRRYEGELALALCGVLRREDIKPGELIKRYFDPVPHYLPIQLLFGQKIARALINALRAEGLGGVERVISERLTDAIDEMAVYAFKYSDLKYTVAFMMFLLNEDLDFMERYWIFSWLRLTPALRSHEYPFFLIEILHSASSCLNEEGYNKVHDEITRVPSAFRLKEEIYRHNWNRELLLLLQQIVVMYFVGNARIRKGLVIELWRYFLGREPKMLINLIDEFERIKPYYDIEQNPDTRQNREMVDRSITGLLTQKGRVLFEWGIARNGWLIVQIFYHEEIEAVMQLLAAKEPAGYRGIISAVLNRWARDEEFRETTKKLLGKQGDQPVGRPDDMYLHDVVATAFQLELMLHHGLMRIDDLSEDERRFYDCAKGLIHDNRHSYFGKLFFDNAYRRQEINRAVSEGFRFKVAATTESQTDQNEGAARVSLPIIADRLNANVNEGFLEALEKRDASYIQREALRQEKNGASYLDVNIDLLAASLDLSSLARIMAWLVRIIEEVVDVPLLIDSYSADVLEAGVLAAEKKVFINSLYLNKEKMARFLPLLRRKNVGVVALASSQKRTNTRPLMAKSAVGKVKAIRKILDAVEDIVPPEDIIVDPALQAMVGKIDDLMERVKDIPELKVSFIPVLEAIKNLRESSPNIKITIGLGNISYGLPFRRMINRVFLAMAMACGLDVPVADVHDRKIAATYEAASIILANWERFEEMLQESDSIPVNPEVLNEFVKLLSPEFQPTGEDLFNRTLIPIAIVKRSLEETTKIGEPWYTLSPKKGPSIDREDSELRTIELIVLGLLGEVSCNEFRPRRGAPFHSSSITSVLRTAERRNKVHLWHLEASYKLFLNDELLEDEKDFLFRFLKRQQKNADPEIAQAAVKYCREMEEKLMPEFIRRDIIRRRAEGAEIARIHNPLYNPDDPEDLPFRDMPFDQFETAARGCIGIKPKIQPNGTLRWLLAPESGGLVPHQVTWREKEPVVPQSPEPVEGDGGGDKAADKASSGTLTDVLQGRRY